MLKNRISQKFIKYKLSTLPFRSYLKQARRPIPLSLPTMNLIVANLHQKNLAFTNKIYLSNSTYSALFPPGATSPIPLLQIHNHIYLAEVSNGVQENEIALNGLQRRAGQLALFDSLVPQPYTPPPTSPLASITFALDFVSKKSEKPKTLPVVNADDLVESFRSTHEMQVSELVYWQDN